MGYIVIIAIALLYCITWNKYYLKQTKGEKHTFRGYIRWLMSTIKKTPEERKTSQETEKSSHPCRKEGARYIRNYEDKP